MKIIHDRDFSVGMFRGYKDEPYFRLSEQFVVKNAGYS